MNSGEEAKERGKFAVSDIDWRKINKEASTLRNIERFDEDGNPLFAVSHDHTDCACGPNEGVTLASTLGVENCHLRIERNAAIKRAEKAEVALKVTERACEIASDLAAQYLREADRYRAVVEAAKDVRQSAISAPQKGTTLVHVHMMPFNHLIRLLA